MSVGAEVDTPDGDEFEVLAVLTGKYEDEYYPMPASNPIEAILELFIGSSGRVSEVLHRKRKLSLAML